MSSLISVCIDLCARKLWIFAVDGVIEYILHLDSSAAGPNFGRTHGAPYRGYGYVPLRFEGGRR